MLMNTSINPPPPIRNRIPCIAHIRTRIKAPRGIGLGADFPSVAEERPDGVGAGCVSRGILLHNVSLQVLKRNNSSVWVKREGW